MKQHAMEKNQTGDEKTKRAYLRPRVKRVVLKPAEAVLGACKTGTTAGPAQPACDYYSMTCSTIGS